VAKHFVSGPTGQIDVEQYQIRAMRAGVFAGLFEKGNGFLSVLHHGERMGVLKSMQRLFHQPDIGGIVLDEQDMDRSRVHGNSCTAARC
jgi:hypothetical protein